MYRLIRKNLGLVFRKKLILASVATCLFFSFGDGSLQIIDGVTAASGVVVVANPTIKLTATPSIVNNSIQAVAGQPVSITVTATDPNGYYAYVYAGLLQAGCFFAPTATTCTSSAPVLPANAKMQLTGAYNNIMTLTWTPEVSYSSPFPMILQFAAYNTYANADTHTQTSAITINVKDNIAPKFDASLSAQQTLVAETLIKLPIIVDPLPDNDTISISANNLPTGSSLSAAAKNAKGQWVSVLSWTPSIAQLGINAVTFTANASQESAQTSFTIDFNVLDLTTPEFSAAMPSIKKAVVNTRLSYNVIIIPDLHSHDVLLTATGLPSGAVLSKPKLSNGQLLATMVWTPNANQLNSSPQVTFTIEDNVPGAIPVTYTATFNVVNQ